MKVRPPRKSAAASTGPLRRGIPWTEIFHVPYLPGLFRRRRPEREISIEVRNRARIFSHGNADSFAADPQILQVVGQVSARAYAAEATLERAARALQGAHEGAFLDDLEEEERLNDLAELETAQAQVILTELATRATSDIFDTLAASGTSTKKNLDRHWRNARTAASHNPWVFKARIVGDYAVNGTPAPRVWSIGAGPKGATAN